MKSISRIFRNVYRKKRVEADLDAEVRSFVDLQTDENLGRGMSPFQARRQALLSTGGVEQVKEAVREVRAGALIEQFFQDMRFGMRMLRKDPAFAMVAILTIALGIGVNAGIFAIINAVAMHPLPVRNAGKVVSIYQVFHGRTGRFVHGDSSYFSYPEYIDYRDHNDVFSGLLAYSPLVRGSFSVTGRQVAGQLTSCNYFDVLQVPMQMGRGFAATECANEGSGAVVVLSDATWRNDFAADPAIVGKTIRLNRQLVQVVGVTAPKFVGTDVVAAGFWAPVVMQHAIEGGPEGRLQKPDISWLVMMGRLKDGVTLAQARSQLALIAARIDRQYPGQQTTLVINVASLLDMPGAKMAVFAVGTVLLLAVSLVLLTVCANVANLMLARATGRRREFAVRLAVGAGKGRIVRQLLTESILLSLIGGALGLLIAIWASKTAVLMILRSLPPAAPPLAFSVVPDFRVFAYTFVIALFTGVVFGLAPTRQATRANLNLDLKSDGGAEDSTGDSRSRLRHTLVAAQVAFCTLLLIATALLVRGMLHAEQRDPGFRMEQIAVASFDLSAAGFDANRATTFHARLHDRLAAIPGVEGVARAAITQIDGGRRSEQYAISGRGERNINFNQVSPGYFGLLDIPIVRGRDFTAGEAAAGTHLAIVTESTARTLWPGEDPVGKHITEIPSTDFEVVGVAKDTDTVHLGRSDEPYIYLLETRADSVHALVLVRSRLDLPATEAAIRAAVRDIDADLPVQVAPLSDNMEVFFAPSRISVGFAVAVGLLALVIASIGIYGTVSYSVGRRTREIGIRMALGATGRDVVRLVLGQISKPLVIGALVGVAASLAIAPALAILLFGLRPFDLLSYACVAAFLIVIGATATYVPARRALRIDPMTAIRHE